MPVEVIASRPASFGRRGAVRTVTAHRTTLVAPEGGGRKVPQPTPGSEFEIAADLVINALGFLVEDAGALTGGQVAMSAQGRIAADRRTRMTAAEGVFVGGDARLGPSLAVWAIREGREAAAALDRYLDALPARARLEPAGHTRQAEA